MADEMKQIGSKTYTVTKSLEVDGIEQDCEVRIEETAFRKSAKVIHLIRNCENLEDGKTWQETASVGSWKAEQGKGKRPKDGKVLSGKYHKGGPKDKGKKGKGKGKKGEGPNQDKKPGDKCDECDNELDKDDIEQGECPECGSDLEKQCKSAGDKCDKCEKELDNDDIKKGECQKCGEQVNQDMKQPGDPCPDCNQPLDQDSIDNDECQECGCEVNGDWGDDSGEGEGEGEGEHECQAPPEPVFTTFEKYLLMLTFGDEQRWCIKAYARDVDGYPIEPGDKKSTRHPECH